MIVKQTPSFPFYGGVKWKTRRLSVKCSPDLAVIFKQTSSFPLHGGIKWKMRSLSVKCFPRHGGDFYIEAKKIF